MPEQLAHKNLTNRPRNYGTPVGQQPFPPSADY